jgi:hypothetical protein
LGLSQIQRLFAHTKLTLFFYKKSQVRVPRDRDRRFVQKREVNLI